MMKHLNTSATVASRIFGILASIFVVNTAFAQQQPSPQNNFQASGWFKTCEDAGANKICNVQFRVITRNGQNVTTLNLIEVSGEPERRVFQIIVPTGRSLPDGIQVGVDDKRAATIPYTYCRPQACTAEVKLDDGLVGIFKRGGAVTITTLNFQKQQNPVPITLKGFTAAYDGPPIKPDNAASRERQLREQLKKKAEQKKENNESE